MRVIFDEREPKDHPWLPYLPQGWELERATLETGDLVLSALPDGAVIERKTPSDMASCIGANRERFEKELKRGRYVGRMIVVIEGTLADVFGASRGISHNAITGTLAPWTLRYCPFVFAGSVQAAADFAFRFLAAQVRDVKRMVKAISLPPGPNSPFARAPGAKRPLSKVAAKSTTQNRYANLKKSQTRKVRSTRSERDDRSSRIYASGVSKPAKRASVAQQRTSGEENRGVAGQE